MPGICARCSRRVFRTEQKVAINKVWHTFCFSCCMCNRLLNQSRYETDGCELYCHTCYTRAYPCADQACTSGDEEPPSCMWPQELNKSGYNVKFSPSTCSSIAMMYNPCEPCVLQEPSEVCAMNCKTRRPKATPTEVNNWHARKNHTKSPCAMTLSKKRNCVSSKVCDANALVWEECSSSKCPSQSGMVCSPVGQPKCCASCKLPGHCSISQPPSPLNNCCMTPHCNLDSCQSYRGQPKPQCLHKACFTDETMCLYTPYSGCKCMSSCCGKYRSRSCSPTSSCRPMKRRPCCSPCPTRRFRSCSPTTVRQATSRSCPPKAQWPPTPCDVETTTSVKSRPCTSKPCLNAKKVNFCDCSPTLTTCADSMLPKKYVASCGKGNDKESYCKAHPGATANEEGHKATNCNTVSQETASPSTSKRCAQSNESSRRHCHCRPREKPLDPCCTISERPCTPHTCRTRSRPCREHTCVAKSPCTNQFNSCPNCKTASKQGTRDACLCAYRKMTLCKRCNCKVYHAERVFAANSTFHNSCFSCFVCRKPLGTITVHEANGEIYCRQCLIRNFGPTGYGYAGTLLSVE